MVTLCLHGEYSGGVTYGNQCQCDDDFIDWLTLQLKKNRLDMSSHAQLKMYPNENNIIF